MFNAHQVFSRAAKIDKNVFVCTVARKHTLKGYLNLEIVIKVSMYLCIFSAMHAGLSFLLGNINFRTSV